MPKRILLLGATGSIGSQTLEIVRQFPQHFSVAAIAGGSKIKELLAIAQEFNISSQNIFIKNKPDLHENKPATLQQFLSQFTSSDSIDIYVNAVSGVAGIEATEEIIKQKQPLCLANKESIVARGEWIMKNKKCEIFPLDSEHSSMANLLSQVSRHSVKKVWLTASGGPFRDKKKHPHSSFPTLLPSQAMAHPNWDMGGKISIDSATLMNKAFEFIEAVRLFNIKPEQIQVVIHTESIIHSAIETYDGNIIMEASQPTMLLPIARELFNAAKKEIPNNFQIPEFSPFGKTLSFEKVDNERFPSLLYAQKALKKGEKCCRQMLEENDKSVELFCQGKISFQDIFSRIKQSIED